MNDTTQVPPSPDTNTAGHDQDTREKVRLSAYGGSYAGSGLHADIHGLDSKELELVEGAMHGHQWITCKDGRMVHTPTYKALPDPLEDETMLPFWRRPMEGVGTQLSLFPFEPLPSYTSPSISIQHLCGYNYSAENYQYVAEKLQRWGFECLRSRRHATGRFHEIWYLPGLWAAAEELRTAIESAKLEDAITDRNRERQRLRAAITFLCRHASFGTLDASYQRAAMVIDD